MGSSRELQYPVAVMSDDDNSPPIVASIEDLAAASELTIDRWHLGAAELSCVVAAGAAELVLVIAPAGSSERFFVQGEDLLARYSRKGPSDSGFRQRTDRFIETCRDLIDRPHPDLRRRLEPGFDPVAIERVDLPWLMNQGLKPAAIIHASDERRLEQIRERLDYSVVGTVGIAEDSTGKIVEGGSRFVYAAQSLADAARLRTIDETVFIPGMEATPEMLQEIGLLLGFPKCCVDVFSHSHLEPTEWDELYIDVQRLGWSGQIGHHLTNFVMARHFRLAFFNHVPCRLDCEATIEANEKLLEVCFEAGTREVLSRILKTSAVLWPSGHFKPFQCLGSSAGVVSVEAVGNVAYRSLLAPGREPYVNAPIHRRGSAGDIDALCVRRRRLRYRAQGKWTKAVRPKGCRYFDAPVLSVFQ